MKFRLQFEFHKIPEWHQEYADYLRFKLMANAIQDRITCKFTFFIILAGEL
jgi:hypothetical protein